MDSSNFLAAAEPTSREAVTKVLETLRRGEPLSDASFDSLLPPRHRLLSHINWTPVEIARRAASLLVRERGTRVLDVGSGVGKFCLVGALTTEGRFHGVERRRALVQLATHLADALGTSAAAFEEGDMADLDWAAFDAVYLYNPFYECLVPVIGFEAADEAPPDVSRFDRSVEIARAKLGALRPGTRVVTYHGFGGHLPIGFEIALREEHDRGVLELWVKGG